MDARTVEAITSFIFLSDEPQESDVILIPGSARAALCERAAELYHAGMAPFVLPSGKYSSKFGRFSTEHTDARYGGDFETEFDYCRHILLACGVPDCAILREDRATNTAENALFSTEVLAARGIDVRRALICAQAYHARRAYMTYARYMLGVELRVVSVETQGIGPDNWCETSEGWKKVLGEVEKCGKYFADAPFPML